MKTCTKCLQELTTKAFGKNKARKDGLQSQCYECRVLTNREYYRKTPEKNEQRRASAKAQKLVNQAYVRNLLQATKCTDCGFDDWRALEFDHVRGVKEYNISTLIGGGYPLDRIITEIEKCDVRCANCHKIVTAERSGSYRSMPR